MINSETSDFIKAKSFYKALGISSSTFYRGVRLGKYPFNKHVRLPGGTLIFPRSLLTALESKALNESLESKGQRDDG